VTAGLSRASRRPPWRSANEHDPNPTPRRDDRRPRADHPQIPQRRATGTNRHALETDLETVTATLRRATDLPPWHDHRALAILYHDCGYSTDDLADLFDGARSAETIRDRMDKLGVDRGLTTDQLLERLSPEDVGLSPMQNDEFLEPRDGQQTLDAFGGQP